MGCTCPDAGSQRTLPDHVHDLRRLPVEVRLATVVNFSGRFMKALTVIMRMMVGIPRVTIDDHVELRRIDARPDHPGQTQFETIDW